VVITVQENKFPLPEDERAKASGRLCATSKSILHGFFKRALLIRAGSKAKDAELTEKKWNFIADAGAILVDSFVALSIVASTIQHVRRKKS
jgi:hypothetical protein